MPKLVITAVHPVSSLLSHSSKSLLIEKILRGAAPAAVLSRLVAPLATEALTLGAHSAPLLVPRLGGVVLSLLKDWVDLGHW